jgi:hypothetical protein
MLHDWTMPFDDGPTERLCRCTVCGRTPPVWTAIHTMTSGLAVAFILCQRCHTRDPQRTRLKQVLAHRYAPGEERDEEDARSSQDGVADGAG